MKYFECCSHKRVLMFKCFNVSLTLCGPSVIVSVGWGVIELVSVVFWNEVSVGMILQFVIELVSVVRGAP